MNLTEFVAMFHGKLDDKLDLLLANQEKLMDDIAMAVTAMQQAAAVLQAHADALRAATAGLGTAPSPAETTVPDPPAVHEALPGGF